MEIWTTKFPFLILLLCLISCDSNNETPENDIGTKTSGETDNKNLRTLTCDTDDANPLVGCWSKEACYKDVADPEDPDHEKHSFIYKKNGELLTQNRLWGNASCSGPPIRSSTGGVRIGLQDYEILKETTTVSDGTVANVFKIIGYTSSAIYYVAYAIQNDRLCMTEGVLIEYGAYRVTNVEGLADSPIDYVNCMVREDL